MLLQTWFIDLLTSSLRYFFIRQYFYQIQQISAQNLDDQYKVQDNLSFRIHAASGAEPFQRIINRVEYDTRDQRTAIVEYQYHDKSRVKRDVFSYTKQAEHNTLPVNEKPPDIADMAERSFLRRISIIGK